MEAIDASGRSDIGFGGLVPAENASHARPSSGSRTSRAPRGGRNKMHNRHFYPVCVKMRAKIRLERHRSTGMGPDRPCLVAQSGRCSMRVPRTRLTFTRKRRPGHMDVCVALLPTTRSRRRRCRRAAVHIELVRCASPAQRRQCQKSRCRPRKVSHAFTGVKQKGKKRVHLMPSRLLTREKTLTSIYLPVHSHAANLSRTPCERGRRISKWRHHA